MISGEAKHTRCVMGRLEKGEEVVDALLGIARFERIDAGFVRAQGAVEAIELLRYEGVARGYVPHARAGAIDGAWELVSLQGSVSLLRGAPDVRVWAVVSAAPGGVPQVLAGLLGSARALFVEFAIDVCDDGDLERRDDPVTGLPLWRPPRRR
jgi:predicted DNA-binding protein with PD1-like motif